MSRDSAGQGGVPFLTARQRDVQAAFRHGQTTATSPSFRRGFIRGWMLGSVIGLPPYLAFLVWWYFS